MSSTAGFLFWSIYSVWSELFTSDPTNSIFFIETKNMLQSEGLIWSTTTLFWSLHLACTVVLYLRGFPWSHGKHCIIISLAAPSIFQVKPWKLCNKQDAVRVERSGCCGINSCLLVPSNTDSPKCLSPEVYSCAHVTPQFGGYNLKLAWSEFHKMQLKVKTQWE